MKTNISPRVWFITGIGRGLGHELARAALAAGDAVIGTVRRGSANLAAEPGRLAVLPVEVTQRDQVLAAVAHAHALHGRLDVIVNNAGYGLLGAIEEVSAEEAEAAFAVNFFGALHVVQAALPFLRAQRHGHIVNISSVAGLDPRAGTGLYSAAKFALGGMTETLAQEVAPLGLRVTLVEPGSFRTEFLAPQSARRTSRQIADYAPTSGRNLDALAGKSGRQTGDPALAARAILEAVSAERPPLHLLLGSDALHRARTKLHELSTEIDRWERVSASTDFAP